MDARARGGGDREPFVERSEDIGLPDGESVEECRTGGFGYGFGLNPSLERGCQLEAG